MLHNNINLLTLLWPWTVTGITMIYSDSLPESLTADCSAAILTDIACDPLVPNLRPDFFYPTESLSRVCTTGCSQALAGWMSSVKSACGNQTVVADLGLEASATMIPGSLDYLFQFTCLQDSGRYCGPVAALAAVFDDPGVSVFNFLSEVPTGAVRPSDCDTCLAERLRLRAGSPYFDGPIVASESLYESVTSSCNIGGKPITTTTIDYFTAQPQPTQNVCDGSTYVIQPSDNCNTIAKSQGVGTAWLLADNNLDAYCADFPSSGSLCITNQCSTVTVGINATCSAVATAANITEIQLRAWNPIINPACSNLSIMNGTEICVNAPGKKFVAPTGTLPPLTPTVAAPIPTDTAVGSNKLCAQWYEVQGGDFCNALTLKFGISLVDFLFLNTGVNENCTNLFANESYCVQAVGDINTYSGRPGYMPITIDPSVPFTGVPFTRLPDATASAFSRYTALPTADGTRDDCVHYFNGADYQTDVNGTLWGSNCALAAYAFGVDLDDLATWNPSLADVKAPSCAFQAGVRYCGSWYLQKPVATEVVSTTTSTVTTDPGTGTGTPKPTPPADTFPGQPADCNKWDIVVEGENCDTMAAAAGISRAQFLAWNPAVSADCGQNFWLKYAYCVGVSGTATATTTSTTMSTPSTTTTTVTTTTNAPGPTKPPANYLQAGQPDNCIQWDQAVNGDYCGKIAERNKLTVSQLAKLNPALGPDGADCGTMIWLNYYYCIATTTTTSS